MTLKQAIEIVSKHQKWRRDQSVPPKTKMQDPTEVGEAIDVLLIVAKDYATIKYFPPDTRPKGWLSIEEYLPMMYAIDIIQGYTIYKVKDKDGNEFESAVSDHNVWYYVAKEAGITHWWNGE